MGDKENGSVTPQGAGHKYDAKSIKVLGGLEAVRLRPAMYIGSTGEMGLHHLVWEVVDNSVDEALAGFADEINVTVHADNSVTVVDNGRGIPVDMHQTEKRPAAEVVLTVLHAGGKFDSDTYKVSGGLHGVGVSVVNALSDWLELEISRDGAVWEQTYEKGKPTNKLKQTGKTRKTGTKVTFHPDPTIFEKTVYSFDTLAQRLRELAFLNKGLKITLSDERTEKTAEFKFTGLFRALVAERDLQALIQEGQFAQALRQGVKTVDGLFENRGVGMEGDFCPGLARLTGLLQLVGGLAFLVSLFP